MCGLRILIVSCGLIIGLSFAKNNLQTNPKLNEIDHKICAICKGNSPEKTINQFIQLAREENREAVKDILIQTPSIYWEDLEGKTSTSANKDYENVDTSKIDRITYNLILEETVPNIFKQKLYVKKIIFVKENQNICQVRVLLGSETLQNFLSLKDFLLYRSGEDWQIFKISFAE